MTECGCGCGVALPDGRRFVRGHNRTRHGPARQPVTELVPRPCACGCGGIIEPRPKHRYRMPLYISGHQTAHAVLLGRPPRKRYVPRPEEIPSGLCECGCRCATTIARATIRAKRYFRGHPVPFRTGHSPVKRGRNSHKWKGGRFTHRSGYVYVYAPDHPRANGKGYVFEHRLVMERILGRLLSDDEQVHHRNEQRDDNRPENLEAMTLSEHMRLHAWDKPGFGPNATQETRSRGGKAGAAARWGRR